MASGASQALDLAIGVLANEGDNILCPVPNFPLYITLANAKGIEVKFYKLIPERSWEADLADMRAQVDERTR